MTESFSVSSKVWNVEFLRNNNIRFKEGMYYEDELFSIKSIFYKSNYIWMICNIQISQKSVKEVL